MENDKKKMTYNKELGFYETELKAPIEKGNFATKVTVTDLFENKQEEVIEIPVLDIESNEVIKKILSLLEIPVAHLKYKGKAKTYVTWTIVDEQPLSASDDEIQYSEITVDIDIYSENNYLSLMSSIKKIMKENSWMWQGDSSEMYEEDTKLHHRTCTFSKERKI